MKRTVGTLLFALALALPTLVYAAFRGQVVGISDGDTIGVMLEGRAVKVRPAGIDCPEESQPFGKRAKQFAYDLAFGRVVSVRERTTDRYGRVVADVVLPDGRNLNHELVRAGMAWWYKRYAHQDRTLKALEAEARANKRGLWADKSPIPPWDWRRGERERRFHKREAAGTVYHGNVRSMVFHRPGCRYYDCKSCTAGFKSREDAIGAGFKPCAACRP